MDTKKIRMDKDDPAFTADVGRVTFLAGVPLKKKFVKKIRSEGRSATWVFKEFMKKYITE